MAYSWFRMYAETAHDPKVQMMTEVMQRRWFMLLCLRCSNDKETFQGTEIEFLMRVSAQQMNETKELFVSKGLVDSEWRVLSWNRRQFDSDSSTERVRKHREKKKQVPPVVKRFSNGPEQNRTEQIQTRKEKPLASTAEAVPASPPVETFPLTEGKTHVVTEADVAAWERAYPAVDVRLELRKLIVWLEPRPAKRSTSPNGNKQRIVRWLTNTQNEGGSRNAQRAPNNANPGPRPSPALQRQSESDEALRNIAARRYGVRRPDGAGQDQVPESATVGGDTGDVPVGLGGDGASVRPHSVPGRVIESHS